MKRVQMILEDWQHNWLADEAERQNDSMSAVLRRILTETIERQQLDKIEDDPIWGIVGMAAGPKDGITSENLDKFIYGTDWHKSIPYRKVAEDGPDYS